MTHESAPQRFDEAKMITVTDLNGKKHQVYDANNLWENITALLRRRDRLARQEGGVDTTSEPRDFTEENLLQSPLGKHIDSFIDSDSELSRTIIGLATTYNQTKGVLHDAMATREAQNQYLDWKEAHLGTPEHMILMSDAYEAIRPGMLDEGLAPVTMTV